METTTTTNAASMKTTFLIINCIILAIGNCGGPLIMRLYFIRGGKKIWFSSWLETGGWPIILIPLLVSHTRRCKSNPSANLFFMTPPVFFAAAFIGTLTGLDNYFYAHGVAKLPVSTSALLVATQLAWTAGFAFLIVKQKFTAYSINAVVLLTVGAVVLGIHTNGDRPNGESNKEYWLGFVFTLLAAAMYGFLLPLIELTYKKVKTGLSYALVLEVQLVMCFFATAFCTVGMLISKDFQKISSEAKAFELGEAKYYLVVVFSAITWQCFFLGIIGVIFYSSSLLSAIIITVSLPATEILAVVFYKEKFQTEKGLSLVLSLWGFFSYFYGEIKNNKKIDKKNDDNYNNNNHLSTNPTQETQLVVQTVVP